MKYLLNIEILKKYNVNDKNNYINVTEKNNVDIWNKNTF